VVTAPGDFFIEPLEIESNRTKALKILKANLSDGSKDYYYVEFRQPIHYDRGIGEVDFFYNNLLRGVIIHQGNNINPDSSLLLDMNPRSSRASDAALEVGKTFSDANAPQGGVSIHVISLGPAGALVSVSFGPGTSQGVQLGPDWLSVIGFSLAVLALQTHDYN
jgi:hypothetical protein